MPAVILPFLLQGLVMFVDEFHFHYKRGLPLWEKIGHPLDTLTTFIPIVFVAWNAHSSFNLNVYIGLAIFSCLFITKDEFIHAEKCDPVEHWLHALLFVLHPIVFLAAGYMWVNSDGVTYLRIHSFILAGFMFYQIVKWSFPWNFQRK